MPLEPDIARRAHAMLMRAMEADPPLRRDLVREACADDLALMRRVLSLLDEIDNPSEFLGTPALNTATSRAHTVPDAIGDYLIVGVLGVGGMASVYEAIQQHPKRRVALKVMHQSMAGQEAYLRFRFETEALARLQHPGIAQIYEAGAACLGQPAPAPFFAMELVPKAVPITTYARQHKLSPFASIEMLASVCDAVHHGHQHGVIHRDLKPANILVDDRGRAKVIDFGVARTTEANGDSITRTTDTRRIIGTLNYMSPEQCDADADIDIRSDVYSLGVVLYELQCHRLPHDLTDLPMPLALHTIAHERATPPNLPRSRANRDLEAIVMKAIEREPSRRYDSASALASDLRRWLNHQPIEARPPGVIEHCRLFARRHRAIVIAGLSIIASILVVAAISTGFAIRLSDEVHRRRIAERQSTNDRDRARWEAYIAKIAGALSAMKAGEFEQMRNRLVGASHPRRGWEWGFLSRLAERSASTTVAHDGMILDLAVDAGWTRFATAASDGVVRLWDARTNALIDTYDRSESGARVLCVAFTANGKSVVTGDDDGVVRLLDAHNLGNAEILTRMSAAVRSVATLPDGRLALAAADGAAQLWTPGPRAVAEFPADQPGGIQGIEAAPNGAVLATFNDQGHIWIRRADSLSVDQRIEFPGGVVQVRFSNDGRMLAAAGASGRVLIWNAKDGSLSHSLPVTQGVNTVRSLAFSHDDSLIAAGLVHRGIVIVSIADGRIVGEVGGHSEAVSALRFRPDDQLLISASWDRTLRTWRTAEFGSTSGATTLVGHRGYVLGVAFAPDGALVASGSRDGTLRLWDPDLAIEISRPLSGPSTIAAIEFSPAGSLIAAACTDRIVRIVDAATGRVVARLEGHERYPASVAFDPFGELIATGADDATARVWDVATGIERLVLRGHKERVNAVRFSPDRSLIATGSRDTTIRLWNAQSGAEVACLSDHTSDVFALLFSSDGRRLYSGSRDQTVRVWDVESRTCLKTLDGHGQNVTSLALSHDQTRLAAGSWFGEIVLFDTGTLDLIASFRAHDAAIRGVAFSPDDRWLTSCSYDGTVRLFDSATRNDAEAARSLAAAERATAIQRLSPYLSPMPADPNDLMARLAEAGIDPARDPWTKKVILSALAPPDERSSPDNAAHEP